METFLTTLHVVAAVSLIITVLLQRGKGSDMGAMLGGGGSQTVFGARGAGNFLTKLTTGCAIVFMVTSLSLAYSATRESKDTIFDGPVTEESAAAGAAAGDAGAASGTLEEVGEAPAGALEEIEDAAAGALEEVDGAVGGALQQADGAATDAIEAVERAAAGEGAPAAP